MVVAGLARAVCFLGVALRSLHYGIRYRSRRQRFFPEKNEYELYTP